MNDPILHSKISEIVNLCNEKIKKQFNHESTSGYYNDYDDGRIVGQAALARRVLNIINKLNKWQSFLLLLRLS